MNSSEKNQILLISHSKTSGRELMSMLEGLNLEFLYAESSSEAINIISFAAPKLIIVETFFGNENCFDLCRMLKTSQRTKLIPIIAISDIDCQNSRVQAIQSGADTFMLKPVIKEELIAHVRGKISQFNEFYLLSTTDELTRLYNRREFFKRFENEIAKNADTIISLAIIDLDSFKQINDLYGHPMGDSVLMKFGEILNKHLSPSFFPTRFGGEEFVITLLGKNGIEAKDIIDSIRREFDSIVFTTSDEKKFSISFSAGISEYPVFGKNLSILLSRADQALYSAKKEGKSRTYIFDPIMAKNDRFWEYLKKSSHFFTDKKNRDAVTNLPFLHSSLESISNLSFEIKSIGIITVKIENISSLRQILGIPVTDFIIENLKIIIKKTCETNFSTDTFISVSDISDYNFIIKFPSIIDFSVNDEKCRTLYRKICRKIEKAFSHLPVHLKFADSIIFFNKKNPRAIIGEIDNLLQKCSFLNKKISRKEEPENIIKYPDLIENKFFEDNFEKKYISGPEPNKYVFISLNNFYSSFSSSFRFLNSIISSIEIAELFLNSVSKLTKKDNSSIVLPKLHEIDFIDYLNLIKNILPEKKVFISINETEISEGKFDIPKDFFISNSSVSLAISDCYISSEILNLISHFDFRLVILSEHLTMCLHCFKDRIKILNGFKIFADQLEIDICSSNVANPEDIQLLKDIDITYSDRNEL